MRSVLGSWVQISSPVAGFQRVDHAPAVRRVHHPVDDQRRALHPFRGAADRLGPGELQVLDVFAGDLVERGEALLLVGLAVGEPTARFRFGGADDALVVDVAGGGRCSWRITTATGGRQQEKEEGGAGCPAGRGGRFTHLEDPRRFARQPKRLSSVCQRSGAYGTVAWRGLEGARPGSGVPAGPCRRMDWLT